MKILVQREDFDCGAEMEAVARGNPKSARSPHSPDWCAT
jgi:hypothetical protein